MRCLDDCHTVNETTARHVTHLWQEEALLMKLKQGRAEKYDEHNYQTFWSGHLSSKVQEEGPQYTAHLETIEAAIRRQRELESSKLYKDPNNRIFRDPPISLCYSNKAGEEIPEIKTPFHDRNLAEMCDLLEDDASTLELMIMIINGQIFNIFHEGGEENSKSECYEKIAADLPSKAMTFIEDYMAKCGLSRHIQTVRTETK